MTRGGYKYWKISRLRHTDTRNSQRSRYYAKHRAQAVNGGSRWTPPELAMIMDVERPADVELSKMLGRSVQAIHVKRAALVKRNFKALHPDEIVGKYRIDLDKTAKREGGWQ